MGLGMDGDGSSEFVVPSFRGRDAEFRVQRNATEGDPYRGDGRVSVAFFALAGKQTVAHTVVSSRRRETPYSHGGEWQTVFCTGWQAASGTRGDRRAKR